MFNDNWGTTEAAEDDPVYPVTDSCSNRQCRIKWSTGGSGIYPDPPEGSGHKSYISRILTVFFSTGDFWGKYSAGGELATVIFPDFRRGLKMKFSSSAARFLLDIQRSAICGWKYSKIGLNCITSAQFLNIEAELLQIKYRKIERKKKKFLKKEKNFCKGFFET